MTMTKTYQASGAESRTQGVLGRGVPPPDDRHRTQHKEKREFADTFCTSVVVVPVREGRTKADGYAAHNIAHDLSTHI